MTPATAAASLAVNRQYEVMLSPLTRAEFDALVIEACHAVQTGEGAAFLIAFDQDGHYENSVNFDWFRTRYDRFIYVDRIAVSSHLQRQGVARAFYEDLIGVAKRRRAPVLCAEVNIDPPNPASHDFHRAMGFAPVGEGQIGSKRVQYYLKRL